MGSRCRPGSAWRTSEPPEPIPCNLPKRPRRRWRRVAMLRHSILSSAQGSEPKPRCSARLLPRTDERTRSHRPLCSAVGFQRADARGVRCSFAQPAQRSTSCHWRPLAARRRRSAFPPLADVQSVRFWAIGGGVLVGVRSEFHRAVLSGWSTASSRPFCSWLNHCGPGGPVRSGRSNGCPAPRGPPHPRCPDGPFRSLRHRDNAAEDPGTDRPAR